LAHNFSGHVALVVCRGIFSLRTDPLGFGCPHFQGRRAHRSGMGTFR
jgi:hypothetical protein